MPAARASAAATHSSTAKKWVSWATNRRHAAGGLTAGSRFGPWRARRAAASAALRPVRQMLPVRLILPERLMLPSGRSGWGVAAPG